MNLVLRQKQLAWFLLLGLISMGFGFNAQAQFEDEDSPIPAELAKQLEQLNADTFTIKAAAKVFFIEAGVWPTSLENIEALLPDGFSGLDPWGEPYKLYSDGNVFNVLTDTPFQQLITDALGPPPERDPYANIGRAGGVRARAITITDDDAYRGAVREGSSDGLGPTNFVRILVPAFDQFVRFVTDKSAFDFEAGADFRRRIFARSYQLQNGSYVIDPAALSKFNELRVSSIKSNDGSPNTLDPSGLSVLDMLQANAVTSQTALDSFIFDLNANVVNGGIPVHLGQLDSLVVSFLQPGARMEVDSSIGTVNLSTIPDPTFNTIRVTRNGAIAGDLAISEATEAYDLYASGQVDMTSVVVSGNTQSNTLSVDADNTVSAGSVEVSGTMQVDLERLVQPPAVSMAIENAGIVNDVSATNVDTLFNLVVNNRLTGNSGFFAQNEPVSIFIQNNMVVGPADTQLELAQGFNLDGNDVIVAGFVAVKGEAPPDVNNQVQTGGIYSEGLIAAGRTQLSGKEFSHAEKLNLVINRQQNNEKSFYFDSSDQGFVLGSANTLRIENPLSMQLTSDLEGVSFTHTLLDGSAELSGDLASKAVGFFNPTPDVALDVGEVNVGGVLRAERFAGLGSGEVDFSATPFTYTSEDDATINADSEGDGSGQIGFLFGDSANPLSMGLTSSGQIGVGSLLRGDEGSRAVDLISNSLFLVGTTDTSGTVQGLFYVSDKGELDLSYGFTATGAVDLLADAQFGRSGTSLPDLTINAATAATGDWNLSGSDIDMTDGTLKIESSVVQTEPLLSISNLANVSEHIMSIEANPTVTTVDSIGHGLHVNVLDGTGDSGTVLLSRTSSGKWIDFLDASTDQRSFAIYTTDDLGTFDSTGLDTGTLVIDRSGGAIYVVGPTGTLGEHSYAELTNQILVTGNKVDDDDPTTQLTVGTTNALGLDLISNSGTALRLTGGNQVIVPSHAAVDGTSGIRFGNEHARIFQDNASASDLNIRAQNSGSEATSDLVEGKTTIRADSVSATSWDFNDSNLGFVSGFTFGASSTDRIEPVVGGELILDDGDTRVTASNNGLLIFHSQRLHISGLAAADPLTVSAPSIRMETLDEARSVSFRPRSGNGGLSIVGDQDATDSTESGNGTLTISTENQTGLEIVATSDMEYTHSLARISAQTAPGDFQGQDRDNAVVNIAVSDENLAIPLRLRRSGGGEMMRLNSKQSNADLAPISFFAELGPVASSTTIPLGSLTFDAAHGHLYVYTRSGTGTDRWVRALTADNIYIHQDGVSGTGLSLGALDDFGATIVTNNVAAMTISNSGDVLIPSSSNVRFRNVSSRLSSTEDSSLSITVQGGDINLAATNIILDGNVNDSDPQSALAADELEVNETLSVKKGTILISDAGSSPQIRWLQIGQSSSSSVEFFATQGTPDNSVFANPGSLAVNLNSGDWYLKKTDAADSNWAQVETVQTVGTTIDQGGNALGATMILGTTDQQDFNLVSNGFAMIAFDAEDTERGALMGGGEDVSLKFGNSDDRRLDVDTDLESFSFFSDNDLQINDDAVLTGQQYVLNSVADSASINDVCIFSGGDLGACTTSLERYKRAIEDWTVSDEQLSALRPVRFEWKGMPTLGEDIGLIAEEVVETLPELAAWYENQLFGVRYQRLGLVLVSAIQTLDQMSSSLRQALPMNEHGTLVFNRHSDEALERKEVANTLKVHALQGSLLTNALFLTLPLSPHGAAHHQISVQQHQSFASEVERFVQQTGLVNEQLTAWEAQLGSGAKLALTLKTELALGTESQLGQANSLVKVSVESDELEVENSQFAIRDKDFKALMYLTDDTAQPKEVKGYISAADVYLADHDRWLSESGLVATVSQHDPQAAHCFQHSDAGGMHYNEHSRALYVCAGVSGWRLAYNDSDD